MLEIYLLGTAIWIIYCTFNHEGDGHITGFFHGLMGACIWPYVMVLAIKDHFTTNPTEERYEPIPAAWLKEPISVEGLSEIYESLYGQDIHDHQDNLPHLKSWSRLIELLPTSDEIRNFDSGFCRGVALLRDEEVIVDVTYLHYRRMAQASVT